MRQVMHLPSAYGHGEHDLFALAPEGMSAEDAKDRINVEIRRVNEDHAREKSGAPDGGLALMTSLTSALSVLGFDFIKPTFTYCWDETPH